MSVKSKVLREVPEVDPPPIGFQPIILRPAVQLGRIIVARVFAAALGELEDPEDAEDRMRLRSRTRTSTQEEDDRDNKRVVKVLDCAHCVREFVDGDVMTAILYQILLKILLGGDLVTQMQGILDGITDCIRRKALQQENSRRFETRAYSRRLD